MAKKTQLATTEEKQKESTALVNYDALATGDGGFGDISKADIAIPFLSILQPLSPACTPGNENYIENARPGMIQQTVTKELFQSINVIPVDYRRTFCEWVPRAAGGGFRGEAGLEREAEFDKMLDRTTGKAKLSNGNDLVDTRNFYVLAGKTVDDIAPAIISMSSSQTKQAKAWVNMILTYIPVGAPRRQYDAWAATYTLSSSLQKNDKGSWFGWKISRSGPNTSAELVEMARSFRSQIRGGTIIIDRSEESSIVEQESDSM